jgi:UDP-GlcNAc:undecaprenyl-phosphate/decaprenyl-phosphate GlcNAc-1-phosphate transferase
MGSRPVAVAIGAVSARVALAALTRVPPGGVRRWLRTNHRGTTVSLLEGPAVAAAVIVSAAAMPGLSPRLRWATALAAGGAGAAGIIDDLAGSGDRRGFRGHLAALREGQITTGIVKIGLIGLTGVVAGGVCRTDPRGDRHHQATDVGVDTILTGALIAGSANLMNLLDLRPGRALKAALIAATPTAIGTSAMSGILAAGLGGIAVGGLPSDLKERSMLGDGGANALGAALGVVTASRASRKAVLIRLGAVIAVTGISERISFSALVDRLSPLRWLDSVGRLPSHR